MTTTISQPETQTVPCHKCQGSGRLTAFSHIENGLCFACGGSGVERRIERTTRKTVRKPTSKVLKSSKYPGWTITQLGAMTFTLTRGSQIIEVGNPTGKQFVAWIGYERFSSVPEAIAAYDAMCK